MLDFIESLLFCNFFSFEIKRFGKLLCFYYLRGLKWIKKYLFLSIKVILRRICRHFILHRTFILWKKVGLFNNRFE
jgi:hypothetical protein